MNEDTYRLLKNWGHYKPRPVAMLAPLVVFAAKPLHTLLSEPSGRELLERCAQRDISWEGFYQSSTELFRALPPEFLELDSASRDAIADTAEFGVFSARDAVILPFLKPEHQQEWIYEQVGLSEGKVDATFAMLAEDAGRRGDVREQFERFVENPGFRFVMRLLMPCFVQHRETPQSMSNRATAMDERDLDAMKELTRLDAGYLTTAPVRRAFADSSLENVGESMQYVASTAGMPHRPLNLRKVKHRMAGFVAFLGYVFGVKLEGSDVRPLFDICAQHIEPTRLTDNDLPDTPESLQKMLSRQRGHWLKHYKPDTNFLAVVRALGGEAA